MGTNSQGIQTFATGAGAGSRMGTPTIGDQYINKHNGALLVYWGAAIGWKNVWSLPWGQRRLSQCSANSDTLAAGLDTSPITQGGGVLTPLHYGYTFDGSLGSITRQYCLTFEGAVGSDVNNDIILVGLNCDVPVNASYNAQFTGLTGAFRADMVGIADAPARLSWRFTHPGNPANNGTIYFWVSAYRLSGSGNCYIAANSTLSLDDLGPSTPAA